MGNRIIKESICTSETIDRLSWFEEVLFYRLIVNCDDYGRFDGRPQIIRGRLFPLKNLTDKTVLNAINKLATAGLVIPYSYDGKPTLQLVTWDKHQTVRNKRSKYAAIDGKDTTSVSENIRLITLENSCNQSNSSENNCVSNPIQSKSIQSESESEFILLSGAGTSSAPNKNEKTFKNTSIVISLTLKDKSEYPIYQKQVDNWSELYPAVDIMQDLRSMKGWLEANPKQRKTRAGILRFVNNWLTNTQNQGGTKGYNGRTSNTGISGDKNNINSGGVVIV